MGSCTSLIFVKDMTGSFVNNERALNVSNNIYSELIFYL